MSVDRHLSVGPCPEAGAIFGEGAAFQSLALGKDRCVVRADTEVVALWIYDGPFLQRVPLKTQESIRQACAFRKLMMDSTDPSKNVEGGALERNKINKSRRRSSALDSSSPSPSPSPREGWNNNDDDDDATTPSPRNHETVEQSERLRLDDRNHLTADRMAPGSNRAGATNRARKGFMERFMSSKSWFSRNKGGSGRGDEGGPRSLAKNMDRFI